MNVRSSAKLPKPLLTGGLLLLLAAMAMLVGAGGGLVGWFGQLFLLTVLVPGLLIALNYRFGLLALVLLMPFAGAQFVPRFGPLSIVNLLMLGVLSLMAVRLALKGMLQGTVVLPLPRQFLLLYLLPITIAYLIGSGHLNEIPPHLLDDDGARTSLRSYWVSSYFKNVLFALCGISVAVAVAEYRNPMTFVYTALASALLYVLATALMFALTPQTLEAAVNSRQMYSATGRHANSVGAMLLAALAATLYMRDAASAWWGRMALAGLALSLVAGVLLTGSRGAMLGLLVVVAIYLWQSRKLRTFLGVALIGTTVLMVAPSAVTDRLTMGLEELTGKKDGELARTGEQLTSGRLYLAKTLLPEVLKHPLFGNGTGSTRWSDYAKSGGPISHPHNLYILSLLDLGLIGSICVVAFVVYVIRLLRAMAREVALPPILRAYFAGTLTGLIGFLALGVSQGTPFPNIDQWFLWIGFGIALGCQAMVKNSAQSDTLKTPADRATAPEYRSRAGAFWSGGSR